MPRSFLQWLLTPAPLRIPAIIAWWEKRRIVYNLAMIVPGVVGLIFVLIVIPLNLTQEAAIDDDFVPLLAVFLGGIAANICYTGGWLAEIIARRLWQHKAEHFGPIAWSLGMGFSIALCFLPGLLHIAIWIIRLFHF